MIQVTNRLVQETVACCGYTQSDEISLVWYTSNPGSQIYFDGRIQKMVSVLAARCSVIFNSLLPQFVPDKAKSEPVFDCRVWQVPTLEEAANTFLWRELDATKNSISMLAREYYSHIALDGKSSRDKQEMLFQKGINWNDCPDFFKRGTYIQRRTVQRKLTEEELQELPALHHARLNPEIEVSRRTYLRLSMPPFNKIVNRVGVIFRGEEPILTADAS